MKWYRVLRESIVVSARINFFSDKSMARATKLDEPEKSIVGHGCPQKDWLLLKELDDIKSRKKNS